MVHRPRESVRENAGRFTHPPLQGARASRARRARCRHAPVRESVTGAGGRGLDDAMMIARHLPSCFPLERLHAGGTAAAERDEEQAILIRHLAGQLPP